MRRSSSSAFFGAGFLIAVPFIGLCERASSRAAPFLATVTPGDRYSESDVKSPERGAKNRMAPRNRSKQRNDSRRHEAKPHHGDNLHGKCSAGDDAGSI